MTLLILIGLVLLAIGIAIRGVLGWARAGGVVGGRALPLLPLVGVVLSAAGLLTGQAAGLPVPLGLPFGADGSDGALALGPFSSLCCLLVFAVAAIVELVPAAADGRPAERSRRDLAIAALLLALLAGDVFLLVTGSVLAMLALGLPGRILGACALYGACLMLILGAAATVLPGALLVDPAYAVLREQASGARGLLLPVLVLVAVVPLLGVWPAQRGWLRACGDAAPAWRPVLASVLGLFLPVRLLVDLTQPAPPAWWGALLAVFGSLAALRAGVSALSQPRLGRAVGAVLSVQNGLAMSAIGVCLLARGSDLPLLASAAEGAVLLLLPVIALTGLAAQMLSRAIAEEAGSEQLARLGGLVQAMPRGCMALGAAASLLCLMPLTGFCGLWLLLQTVLAVPVPLVVTVLVVLPMLGAACLTAAAMLRLGGVVVLGRPRTPRGAAAQELHPTTLRWIGVLLLATLLVGLFPGLWLGLNGSASRAGWLGVAAGAGTALYPLPVLALVVLAGWGVRTVVVRFGGAAEDRQPAFEGGAPPSPPWLPFGDPQTQPAAGAIGAALRQAVLGRLALPLGPSPWRRRAAWQALQVASGALGGWLRRNPSGLAVAILVLGATALLVGVPTP